MFKAIVLHSSDPDTDDAISEIMQQYDSQNPERLLPQAAILFCSTDYNVSQINDQFKHALPDCQLIGCTTDGEMSSHGGFVEGSICLTLFFSDDIEFSVGYGLNTSDDPANAARQAVINARSRLSEPPVLALTLPDGLTTRAYPMLQAMQALLGEEVPILGGTSADDVLTTKQDYHTWQFVNGELFTDATPVLLFSGPLLFSLGVESGWSPLGANKKVVRQVNGQVFELEDDETPLNMYQHYLGKINADNRAILGSFPLAVFDQHDENQFYLRVASNADSESGAMSFMAEVPEGSRVKLTQSIRRQVVQGVSKSVNDAMNFYPGKNPAAALTFSCTGRKLALGSKTYQEIQIASEILPRFLPICGFYTFGEIAPLTIPGQSYYHNATFVTLLLGIE